MKRVLVLLALVGILGCTSRTVEKPGPLWHQVGEESNGLMRVEVPGGWLYKYSNPSDSIAFVPDSSVPK